MTVNMQLLENARQVITKKNSELKYGKKYPRLDPENEMPLLLLQDWMKEESNQDRSNDRKIWC